MNERSLGPIMTPIRIFSLLLWCSIAAAALTRYTWLGPIEVLFLFAPLVTVPLGFRVVQRLRGDFYLFGRFAVRLLPLGAVAAAASFWLVLDFPPVCSPAAG